MKMAGNTVLVIGGTSGIGRALAEALHDRGNRIIVTGRRQAMLDQITESRPGIIGLRLDLVEPASLSRVKEAVYAQFPELNVLIANAGVSRPEDLTSDRWKSSDAELMIETNILGVLRATAAFLPLLRAQQDSTIMATSSALAFVPLASFPTYCASKAFLHSWLTSLRHQLRRTSVEVFELSPPYVQTELTGPGQVTDPRAMPVPDYVAQVMHLLEQGKHPAGELLLERDHARRWAERDGTYVTLFSAMNPD
jgi:uncharacterized oxidoreductase